MKEIRTIEAKDGYPLEITTWLPDDYETVVLIGPGMGIRRSFYHAFALHLLEQNLAAVTVDFRGIGGSKDGPVNEIETDATAWARQDLGGCIQWMDETFPDCSLRAVLHSFSGQTLGLADEATRLERIVTIVTGGGYWNLYPFPKNIIFALVWYGLFPLSTRTLGYFPGELLGLGEDLPAGVALEVARWSRSPGYINNYSTYGNVTAPILSYSFTDDPYCPKETVDFIHEQYSSADVVRRHVDPDQTESERIGHFGFFRNGNVPGLWADVTDWLRKPSTASVEPLKDSRTRGQS